MGIPLAMPVIGTISPHPPLSLGFDPRAYLNPARVTSGPRVRPEGDAVGGEALAQELVDPLPSPPLQGEGTGLRLSTYRVERRLVLPQ